MDRINIIPNLAFDDTSENQGSLTDFSDRLLALPNSTRITKFSVKCRRGDNLNYYANVNRLLCNVLKRGVLELELDLWVSEDKDYSLPSEVFTCKTLVQLTIRSILKIDKLPENALLPALRTLIINSVKFYDRYGRCAFQKLLSACPVLAELMMFDVEWEQWEWSRTVSSPTLERFSIIHKYRTIDGIIDYDLESISIDTPRLTCLKYFDFAPRSYPIVNLGSLVEATVSLTLPQHQTWSGEYGGNDDDTLTCDITNLVKGLRNVAILEFYDSTTMEEFYLVRDAIPVFEKLHHLSVASDEKFGWRVVPYLLKKSPNLKTLVIAGALHKNCYMKSAEDLDLDYECGDDEDEDDDEELDYDDDDNELVCECLSEYSFLLSCPVKVLEITEYNGTRVELAQVKHFLEKLKSLELVKVRVCEPDKEERFKIRTNLLKSSKCKVKFEFVSPGGSL